jgi:hypothetical protein
MYRSIERAESSSVIAAESMTDRSTDNAALDEGCPDRLVTVSRVVYVLGHD